jgi:hypothetical protein
MTSLLRYGAEQGKGDRDAGHNVGIGGAWPDQDYVESLFQVTQPGMIESRLCTPSVLKYRTVPAPLPGQIGKWFPITEYSSISRSSNNTSSGLAQDSVQAQRTGSGRRHV